MGNSASFTFYGRTIWRPGILTNSQFGNQRVLQLLPTGLLCFIGPSDGGQGGGTLYQFSDTKPAEQILRSGPLLSAIQNAANIGGASGFIAVVVGAKTPATLVVNGTAGASGTLTTGDQGTLWNAAAFAIVTGTSHFAAVFTIPAVGGGTFTYGGKGTAFDNLQTMDDLAKAIAADPVLTPPASSGYPPIFTFTVTTPGSLAALTQQNLAGGTGSGSMSLVTNDWKAGVDVLANVAYDIVHMVGCTDPVAQAYLDGAAQQQAPFGRFHRCVHQAAVSGTSPSNDKQVNSTAIANSGIAAANALNSIRSSVCAQKLLVRDPNTGNAGWVDGAIIFCGQAALDGATGQWGPATPLTLDVLANVLDVDYPVLDTTGDLDRCIQQGVVIFERFGTAGQPGSCRIVQSLTTAPNDPNGNAWDFREFSVVRVSDALLANVKAQVETSSPKALGGGNTIKTMGSIIADVVDVLELALDNGWITAYDKSSIVIAPTGNLGTDDIVRYSASPTLPLNHLGIDQTLIPFETSVSTSGVVNG